RAVRERHAGHRRRARVADRPSPRPLPLTHYPQIRAGRRGSASVIPRQRPGSRTTVKTARISHPAFSGTKRDETVHFYRDILGMELVLLQDNLDVPEEDHFFFHVGEDN